MCGAGGIGAAVISLCGAGFSTGSCVDTDGSLTDECIGPVHSLIYDGCTYVRGYDGYTVTSSGVVVISAMEVGSVGMAYPAP